MISPNWLVSKLPFVASRAAGGFSKSDWIASTEPLPVQHRNVQNAFKTSVLCLLLSETIMETERMLTMTDREIRVGTL